MIKRIFLNHLTSGFLTLSASLGLNIAPASAISPITPPEPSSPIIALDLEEQTNIRVYEKASPAVVSIDTEKANGSGAIITDDGMVLTNAHVVSQGGQVEVTLADGRKMVADVVAYGENGLDLALLKIRNARNLPTIPIARPGSVRVGQRAFAIGNPFGQFQNTFTVGIVSRIDLERNLIQTDAAINPGNSGGPLLNSQGELIGVNTAIFTRGRGGGNIGIGFAISVDNVPPFLQAAKEGRAPRTAQQQRPIMFNNQDAKPLPVNGQEVRGVLAEDANVLPVDNSFYNLYTFEGEAGQQVIIDMMSDDFDSYLILLDIDGNELAQDDDGGGNTNARIQVTLPDTGTYTLLANSYQAGETGNYRLRLRTVAGGSRSELPSSDNVMLRRSGMLDSDNASVLPSDGSLYREYSFDGQAGQSVRIDLTSSDFDTYLALFSSNGRLVGENDDISDTDTNSRLTVTLPATGPYRVVVNAFDSTGRGQYLLTVREVSI
ncbi:MAG: trypsin-like peptidase domain-containing protein [Arthrospira sp. SH-MAG29]|nr:trypsin-like peptidase domain-containing protein [Arthrospira sp. SH-MAG29]MBS0016569.1 trypsin-like peptidase domain-containing protein [Arthrospira sp. SH-MAG29]